MEELKAKLAEAEDAAESEETRYHSSEWTVQHLAQELDKAKQVCERTADAPHSPHFLF